MNKQLVGMDTSYLNWIAKNESELNCFLSQGKYLVAPDHVLTEALLPRYKKLMNNPNSFSETKPRLQNILAIINNPKCLYDNFGVLDLLYRRTEAKKLTPIDREELFELASILKDSSNFNTFIQSFNNSKASLYLNDIQKKYQSQENWRKAWTNKYNPNDNADMNIAKTISSETFKKTITKHLSEGIEIETILSSNPVEETTSTEKFIESLKGFGYEEKTRNIFANEDIEVTFNGNRVIAKAIKDEHFIKNNYTMLYLYICFQVFVAQAFKIKTSIKNHLVDMKIGLFTLPNVDRFLTCDKKQAELLQKFTDFIGSNIINCEVKYIPQD